MSKSTKIMIVAGEASGDAHAAKLVNAIRAVKPKSSFEFFGAVGPRMREAGVDAIVDSDDFSVVGLPEIGRALPMFWKAFRKLRRTAGDRKPNAAILVDFPEFNLKLAKSLKKSGFKVVYYISPQIWAWRKYRIRLIRKYVDLMITILPFEEDWYRENGMTRVEYVGSPLAREVHPDISKQEFCLKYELDPLRPIVSLLPGSRRKEISRILPQMILAVEKIAAREPKIQFIITLATDRNLSDVETILNESRAHGVLLPERLLTIQSETYNALKASDAAAVTSGTATLETGIIGTPMAIVYKTSLLNYKLLRPLISVEHFGLINLIAKKRIARELIQDDFTPDSLATELFRILEPAENSRIRLELKDAVEKLGHGGASKRAAEAIIRVLADDIRDAVDQ